MTWYFNNEGTADGPHEDDAMRALLAQKRIHARTLVWHPGAATWDEVEVVSPAWWKPAVAVPAKAKPAKSEGGPRGLTPLAPGGGDKSGPGGGFLKRLFGLVGKK
ncbi:uncharacterized protein DUF4339 [Prosthecobacter fusiformis]|uniref:Uncharacterized protein DUF4339 n=1 Tax=Prosthecobacter fusiformis TaxID=48464 RepID=A0A4R7SPP7_9BACT|nr:DUF4339 domain-containing protein [Prosthecobacter fusiformis]TDU81180.1 uncharacterized protein DUF4339 [Prosthecobacter fusiformis]